MYYQLFSSIHNIKKTKPVEREDPIIEIIDKWEIDIGFKRALQWEWFSEGINVGPELYSVYEIAKNEQKYNNISRGLLEIGFCPNGDHVMITTGDLSVVYWSHDNSEDWDKKKISECIPCYKHIYHLLLSIHNNSFIPWDSYCAKDYYAVFNEK